MTFDVLLKIIPPPQCLVGKNSLGQTHCGLEHVLTKLSVLFRDVVLENRRSCRSAANSLPVSLYWITNTNPPDSRGAGAHTSSKWKMAPKKSGSRKDGKKKDSGEEEDDPLRLPTLILNADPRYRIKPMQQVMSALIGGLITTFVGE